MAETTPHDKRVSDTGYGSPKFGFQGQIPKSRAWVLSISCLFFVALTNALAPAQAWLGPAYLMVIGYAAWTLGWKPATAMLLVCTVFALWMTGLEFWPHGPVLGWMNLGLRMTSAGLIIGLLDNARRSCEREWLLARLDPLTGALNRKAFFELVGDVDYCGAWNILAYADLDGLKKLNDDHGHASGDASLKSYAEHVKGLIRKDDLFARIGGDEFLIYMAVKDEQSAKSVAARLHKAMNTVATTEAQPLECSLGVLILAPGPRSIDRDLRLADELMYEAKQRGAGLNTATALVAGGELFLFEHGPPDSGGPGQLRSVGMETQVAA